MEAVSSVPGNWAWKLTATSGNSSNSENSEVEGNYSSGTVGDIESENDQLCSNKLQRHPQSHRRKSRKIQRYSTGESSSSPELTQKQKPSKCPYYSGRAHHTESPNNGSTTQVKDFQATQSCNNSDHSEPELYQPQQEDVRYECEQLRREVMRLKQENNTLKMQLKLEKVRNGSISSPVPPHTVGQCSNYNDLL